MNNKEETKKAIKELEKKLKALKEELDDERCDFHRGQIVLVRDNIDQEWLVRVFYRIDRHRKWKFETYGSKNSFSVWKYCKPHPEFPFKRDSSYNCMDEVEIIPVKSKNQNGWVEWNGGECPVDGNFIVDVKFKDGDTDRDFAWVFWWGHQRLSENCNIIAYRIIGYS